MKSDKIVIGIYAFITLLVGVFAYKLLSSEAVQLLSVSEIDNSYDYWAEEEFLEDSEVLPQSVVVEKIITEEIIYVDENGDTSTSRETHSNADSSSKETVSSKAASSKSTSSKSTSSRATSSKPKPPSSQPEPSSEYTGIVNINTAGYDELCSLTGIGDVIANRIIEYRELCGGFTSIEELLFVSGIGDKKLDAIRDRITV